MAALTKQEKDFINFVEQYWYTKNRYPTERTLIKYGESVGLSIESVHKLEEKLESNLAARGIINRTNRRLSPEQLTAINLVVNFIDKRPLDKKLEAVGVSPTKWQGWLRDQTFAEHLRYMTDEMLEVNMPAINNGLLYAAQNGSVRAAQFAYEVTGKYKKDSPIANIQLLIIQIIEVIQKYVKEPDTLRAISADFEVIMLKSQIQDHGNEIEGEIISNTPQQPKISRLSNAISNNLVDPDDIFG